MPVAKRQTTRTRTTRSRQEAPARTPRRETVQVSQTVAVTEAETSDGMTGTVILTTVLLVVAILCVDALLGSYGSGVFF
jgi:hypothetical protein